MRCSWRPCIESIRLTNKLDLRKAMNNNYLMLNLLIKTINFSKKYVHERKKNWMGTYAERNGFVEK